jgi:hypothetical protein
MNSTRGTGSRHGTRCGHVTSGSSRTRWTVPPPASRTEQELMKIYTRKGDAGETSIWAGRRLRNVAWTSEGRREPGAAVAREH